MNYCEVYGRLGVETAIVKFEKKDGTIRLMLATRNMSTADIEHGNRRGLLAGHDKRCSINNGNIAVIDLMLGEGRSFSIDRLIYIEFMGEIKTQEEYDRVYEIYSQRKRELEAEANKEISMDDL